MQRGLARIITPQRKCQIQRATGGQEVQQWFAQQPRWLQGVYQMGDDQARSCIETGIFVCAGSMPMAW